MDAKMLEEIKARCDAAMSEGRFFIHSRSDIPALLSHIEHQRRALECLAVSARIALGDVGDNAYLNAILAINDALNATKEVPSE